MRFKKLLLGSLNDINNFSSRVAYNLNLRGPAIALRQPALHHLWLFIWLVSHFLAGDCDMAVAGGVSITVPIKEGYLYEEGMIYSEEGIAMLSQRMRTVPFSAMVQVLWY